MMNPLVFTVLVGVGFCTVAHAGEQQAGRSCADVKRIRSWEMIDQTHIYVSYLDKRRKFKVAFLEPCRELKWATIMLLGRVGPGRCLSPGDSLLFKRTPWDAGESCWVTKVEAVPPKATNSPEP